MMNRKHLPASLLMMSVLLFLMSAAAEAKEPVMAPRIEAPTLNGDMQMVPEKGKKTILHFWTTWCPSCKMELPEFEQIVKENQSDVDILTVNLLGAEQSKHAVAQFVKDRRFTFPIILDEHGEMMKKYQIITIPTTFLINEKGEVVKNHVGPLTKKQIKEWTNS
ncbi:Sporulation thiol-disulfide oxidoreductase A [Bacillus safensis]|nr:MULTISPECIES: endospore biogenesis thiol-disulfide oxidoreductase StoA [Bacillus]MED4593738.1 endospore biogenesis thiol-disulfide oxidoreductase StoA [Bacillus safensis]MED4638315.1 endospore biogenesis thiol-disulfide oxidoreductase StoA [Bacillus safensis]WBL29898.1 Sporulation thiol-disulfide oxidoreductase A [Bacillus safensis]VCT96393.1 Sporulation thiol-disulfide oxidoreductase A [Bacillus safensis]